MRVQDKQNLQFYSVITYQRADVVQVKSVQFVTVLQTGRECPEVSDRVVCHGSRELWIINKHVYAVPWVCLASVARNSPAALKKAFHRGECRQTAAP